MNKMMRLVLLVCVCPFFCHGQEEKKTTLSADRMTLEKARVALAKSEEEKAFKFQAIFDLPKEIKPEIIDTKLTYQKALAVQVAEGKEIKKLTAELDEKRRNLTKMIVSYANPHYTQKQYNEAKTAYIKARDQLRKIKASGDDRLSFQKASKKK